jgi:hypothetical protein
MQTRHLKMQNKQRTNGTRLAVLAALTVLPCLTVGCGDTDGTKTDVDGSAGAGTGGSNTGGNGGSSSTGGTASGGVGGSGGNAVGGSGGGGVGGGGTGFGFPAAPTLTFNKVDESEIFEDVAVLSADDVYAVGRSGRIRHYKNGAGTTEVAGTSSDLTGIWATSPTDIHVSTKANAALHSSGDGKWKLTVMSFTGSFNSIWASSPDDVYMAGTGIARKKNNVWVQEDDGESSVLQFVWGLDAQHVYAGAALGILLFSKGDGKWSRELLGAKETVYSMWGDALDNLFVIAGDGLFHKGKDQNWVKVTGPGDSSDLVDVRSGPGLPLYVLSQRHVYFLNSENQLEKVSQQSLTVAKNIGISSASDIWLASTALWRGLPQ